MGQKVIYGNKGKIACPGKGFGEVEADKEGTQKAGMGNRGDTFDTAGTKACLFEGFKSYAVYPFGMHPTGDFGYNTLPACMNGYLGSDYIGKDAALVYNRGGAFVAGTFYAEDFHLPASSTADTVAK
jgi:hypothetical protein